MDERIEKWLYDIKMSIEEIDSFFLDTPKSFLSYRKNLLLKRAIERNLLIIGEATKRILAKEPDFQLPNARKIVNLRNFIAHAYDSVSDENIWAIIVNNLPELKKDIDNLIQESE